MYPSKGIILCTLLWHYEFFIYICKQNVVTMEHAHHFVYIFLYGRSGFFCTAWFTCIYCLWWFCLLADQAQSPGGKPVYPGAPGKITSVSTGNLCPDVSEHLETLRNTVKHYKTLQNNITHRKTQTLTKKTHETTLNTIKHHKPSWSTIEHL